MQNIDGNGAQGPIGGGRDAVRARHGVGSTMDSPRNMLALDNPPLVPCCRQTCYVESLFVLDEQFLHPNLQGRQLYFSPGKDPAPVIPKDLSYFVRSGGDTSIVFSNKMSVLV